MDDVPLNTYGLTHATLLASLEAGVENFVQFGDTKSMGRPKPIRRIRARRSRFTLFSR